MKGWEKKPDMGSFGTKLSYLRVEYPNALERGNEYSFTTNIFQPSGGMKRWVNLREAWLTRCSVNQGGVVG